MFLAMVGLDGIPLVKYVVCVCPCVLVCVHVCMGMYTYRSFICLICLLIYF